MLRKIVLVSLALAFAFGILFISAFRTASTKYQFNPQRPADVSNVLGKNPSKIDYPLPYPGHVLPDSPFWPLKSVRDKFWFTVTTNPTRKAELKLLFADKRLGSAKLLADKGKPEFAVSTLTKAEKYLDEAYNLEKANKEKGYDTTEFLEKIATASLKHYEVIEYVLTLVPEEARPTLQQIESYPKKIYEDARNRLLDRNIKASENPFNW